MSMRLVIDSLDFVRNARTHHDKIALVELSRLQDFLYENIGMITYEVSGSHDERGKPNLNISVKGEMQLCCQRCLGELRHKLDLQSSILLAKDEAELDRADQDDSIDAILATSDLDVLGLIEDEIILSLSMSSRHPEGVCEINKIEGQNKTENQKNPFSALEVLKKTN